MEAPHDRACTNGRIRGMKRHLAYSPATRNDAGIGRQIPLERGATYVFEKGCCRSGRWSTVAEAGAAFVTRPTTTMRLTVRARHRLPPTPRREGDGFAVAPRRHLGYNPRP